VIFKRNAKFRMFIVGAGTPRGGGRGGRGGGRGKFFLVYCFN
jgi:hypothetical protein